jgi:hypothetical protein
MQWNVKQEGTSSCMFSVSLLKYFIANIKNLMLDAKLGKQMPYILK